MSRTVRSTAQISFLDELPSQPELLDGAGPAESTTEPPRVSKGPPATREEHLAAMHATLAFLRGCDACPWNAWEVHFESWLFRQRATWHPPATAEPLLAAFLEQERRLDFRNAPPDPDFNPE